MKKRLAQRVLFVVNADWFFVSHRLGLARAVREAGYDVLVCAGQSEAAEVIRDEGFEFHPLPIERGGTNPLKDAVTIGALAGLYRRIRPDIVHHVTVKPVLYGSAVARSLGVRGIVNAVSGLGYAFIERDTPSKRHAALRLGITTAYRFALGAKNSRVIFQNRDDCERFVQGGLVKRERTRLIPGSGVDTLRFSPTPLPQGVPIALLPARLLWDKGVGEFVEAARQLRSEGLPARFVLVGRVDPGNPASISLDTVEKWVAEGVVEWWGEKRPHEMPDVYGKASVVVLPSYREGLPLALAEAAACGRAVITSDVPGCRDTVDSRTTGWLVEVRSAPALAKCLGTALRHPDELERRGAAAASFARGKFRQERVFSDTLRIYDELVAARNT